VQGRLGCARSARAGRVQSSTMSDDRKGPNLAALGASIESAYNAAGVLMLRLQINSDEQ